MERDQGWYVLLLGGPSGVVKTTVAAKVASRLRTPWSMADDLRLALLRSGVAIPNADAIGTFDAPGGLVALGEAMTPAIEVLIENHVDQRVPVVIEGDAILPSLFDRLSVRTRVSGGRVRAVFLTEPDEGVLMTNFLARRGDARLAIWQDSAISAHVRKNYRYGEWLEQQARHRGLPALPVRPRDSAVERIIAAIGLPATVRPGGL